MIVRLVELSDAEPYLVATTDSERGVSTGRAIKTAMRHGKKSIIKTYPSSHSPIPPGYVMVRLTDEAYIAVRCLSKKHPHRAEIFTPETAVVASQPRVEAPRPVRSFKRFAGPRVRQEKLGFAKAPAAVRRFK